MDFNIWEIVIAAVTGFSAGMFGIGGSVIATPLLLLTGVDPLFALTTPVAVAFFSSASGSAYYIKKKMIHWRLAFLTLLAAVPFSILGKYLIGDSSIKVLIIVKALFLLILAVKFFFPGKIEQNTQLKRDNRFLKIALIGSAGGFLAGILAIGGGIVFVTAFAKILKYDLKESIATSLFCVGIISFINTINHVISSTLDIRLAAVLVIIAIPFSFLGARTAVRLRNKVLELAFGIILVVFSSYFIINFLASY